MAGIDYITVWDVHARMKAKACGPLPPLRAFLVNFEAKQEFPRKFYYHGCTTTPNGRPCTRIVEGLFACDHNSIEEGKWAEMYRFDVFLADATLGPESPPLKATCFNVCLEDISMFQCATDLIGLPAKAFAARTDLEQFSIVHGVTTQMHHVEVTLRLKEYAGEIHCLMQAFSFMGDDECEVLHSSGPKSITPRRNTMRSNSSTPPSSFYTPRTSLRHVADQGSSGRSSSAGGRSSSAGGSRTAHISSVKAKLLDLIQSLEDSTLN